MRYPHNLAVTALLIVFLSSGIHADECSCAAEVHHPVYPPQPITCDPAPGCDDCSPKSSTTTVPIPGTSWFCGCDGTFQEDCCNGVFHVEPDPTEPGGYVFYWFCTAGGCTDPEMCKPGGSGSVISCICD